MSETQAPKEAPTPIEEDRDYKSVLQSLVGKRVTVVNPESYEPVPMAGFQLKAGNYTGAVVGWGRDFLIFQTLVTMAKKEGGQQPVKQYIPIERIKRISAMKAGIVLHI